ncbi:MAG: methyltransferase domain-containing protein [Pseudolabrys sp.]
MPDFSSRSGALEWLDTAAPPPAERAAYFRSLARLNGVMLGHWPVLRWLASATANHHEPLTVLDVGCGYGDLLRAIRRWADRRGLPLRLIGVDVEPDTVAIAREATPARAGIDYLAANIFNLRPSFRIDLVVSSLVAHHLDDERVAALLRWMEATARLGWMIADLERHPVAYHAIGVAGRLLGVHPMVIGDGRISVTRALERSEWRQKIGAAGIDPDAVRLSSFLYRVAVARLKT